MADPRYTPHLFARVWILLCDLVLCVYSGILSYPPFLADWLSQTLGLSSTPPLPSSIAELVDVETYSRVAKRAAVKVEFASQREQHANSTDRAWLRVRYADADEDTLVFAKCQAKNFMVRSIMSAFDVYRNELNAYTNIKMPVVTPKIHVAKWTRSRFVLVMEDLSSQGVEFPNIWSKHVDMALGKKVLDTIARIHAKFYGADVPPGVWRENHRPYMGLGMGMYTLFNVESRCKKGLIPPEIHDVFMQALWHWGAVREYLTRSQPQVMCHGDTHMGNFYIQKDGSVGTFDFQVLSQEHPMRDVAYFLSSSYDPELLEKDEKVLIQYYLERLDEHLGGKARAPTFENAWFNYRIQLFYAMYAFVFSGGFANLMDHVQTECGVERIVRVMQRVDSKGALYDMLDGRATA